MQFLLWWVELLRLTGQGGASGLRSQGSESASIHWLGRATTLGRHFLWCVHGCSVIHLKRRAHFWMSMTLCPVIVLPLAMGHHSYVSFEGCAFLVDQVVSQCLWVNLRKSVGGWGHLSKTVFVIWVRLSKRGWTRGWTSTYWIWENLCETAWSQMDLSESKWNWLSSSETEGIWLDQSQNNY